MWVNAQEAHSEKKYGRGTSEAFPVGIGVASGQEFALKGATHILIAIV